MFISLPSSVSSRHPSNFNNNAVFLRHLTNLRSSCPQIGCPFTTENLDALSEHLLSKQVGAKQRRNPSATKSRLHPPSPWHLSATGSAPRSIAPADTALANRTHVRVGSAYYNPPNFYIPVTPAEVLETAYGPPDGEPRSNRPVKPVTQHQWSPPTAQGRGAQQPHHLVSHRQESLTLATDSVGVATGAQEYDEDTMMANRTELVQVYEAVGIVKKGYLWAQ
ncbi:hypothetical protein FB45DRAFT_928162 [Roridomyces roridus]|uniref:Uncharacterized protein n=1 Tax=Roridomyces roridus TaxID=1738132 RepID=A0AAD7FIL4_9AGAR|nr:hypothetical protein FB45DRAFT_928162 [Roridomyces roridus]